MDLKEKLLKQVEVSTSFDSNTKAKKKKNQLNLQKKYMELI